MYRSQLIILMIVFVFACESFPIDEPGNLVPRTVTEDLSIPQINVNGTVLHSEAFGDPMNPMLIFLHGGPGGDYRNAMVLKALADDGYRVIFYDQRGSGLSKRHNEDAYNIQVMLDDLNSVIEHYRQFPAQKVFLFGHSWGGMLAAAFINQNPDAIDGAIFAEPGGLTKKLLDRYNEKSHKISLLSEAVNDVFYFDQFISGDENDHCVLDYKISLQTPFTYGKSTEGVEGPSPFWRYGAVVLRAFIDIAENDNFDFTTSLSQYNKKVLFLYGENNKSYGLAFAKTEAAYFPSADIIQIDNTGHEMIYFQWPAVHQAVLSYLLSQ